MTQIRTTLSEFLLLNTPLEDLFDHANQIFAARRSSTMATIGVVEVETNEHAAVSLTMIEASRLLTAKRGTPVREQSLTRHHLRQPKGRHGTSTANTAMTPPVSDGFRLSGPSGDRRWCLVLGLELRGTGPQRGLADWSCLATLGFSSSYLASTSFHRAEDQLGATRRN